MTQKEKQELLIALCEYLPYGVKCYDAVQNEISELKQIEIEGFGRISYGRGLRFIEHIKPYLRSLSSMTEEEEKEFQEIKLSYHFDEDGYILFDWLNAHYFDYRGLIEKGLALEAPKGRNV